MFIKGEDGRATECIIKDLLDGFPQKTVHINGKPYTVSCTYHLQWTITTVETQIIRDRDQIECKLPETIEDLLTELGLQNELNQITSISSEFKWKRNIFPPFSGKLFPQWNGGEIDQIVMNI